MHRILLRQICLDLAPDVHDAGLSFWRAALRAEAKQGVNYPEYHHLEHAAAVLPVYVQHIGAGTSHVHLDIESDDGPAEVARLVALGASIVAEHESGTVGDWTVLRDPAGLLFCVVTAEVDAAFEANAVSVD